MSTRETRLQQHLDTIIIVVLVLSLEIHKVLNLQKKTRNRVNREVLSSE